MNALILAERDEQIAKGIDRDVEFADGVAQGNKNGMHCSSAVASLQLRSPPVQQLTSSVGACDFVAQVIGPPAIRVYVVEVLAERARKQIRRDSEVFVMTR